MRGVSGAVRVNFLRRLLDELDEDQIAAVEVSGEPLRKLSEKRYPTELLKVKVLQGDLKRKEYQYDTGRFTVTILTPVIIGKLSVQDELMQAENRYRRRGRKIHDPSYRAMDEPFYDWHRSVASSLRLGLTVFVEPQFTETLGSRWGRALLAGLASAGGGYYDGGTPTNFKYKGEFFHCEIHRDDQLLEPVRPGRTLLEASRRGLAKFVDEAYAGRYVYAPEDFMTGDRFRFVVFEARQPGKAHHGKVFKADSKLIQQIRSDFREALGKGVEYWEKDYDSEAEPPGTGVLLVGNEAPGFYYRQGRGGIDLVEVLADSPAYEAGLRTGDTLLRIDGARVLRMDAEREVVFKDPNDVLKEVRKGKIQESDWTIRHRGQERTVRVINETGKQ